MNRPTQSLEDYANESVKPLQELLQRAADSGLCGILPMVTKEGSGEDITLSLHGITITPKLVSRPSIRGVIDLNGWQISDWKHVSNYPHEPDDVDEIEVGEDTSLSAIVRMVMAAIFNRKFEDWLQQDIDARWANFAQQDD